MGNNNLKQLNILLAGQVITSRTETIEDYLKDKVNSLGVVGIASPYAIKGIARCTLYERAIKKREFSIPGIRLKGPFWLTQPLLSVVFTVYFISMVIATLRLKKKFDIFIGIACFSMLVGLFLKKIGVVKHLIYYTIDYYPLPQKFCFSTLMIKMIWALDRFCVRSSDIIWHISPRITEARKKFAHLSPEEYKYITVPMVYSSHLLRTRPFSEIERWTIGFVGTLSWNQGLQLLIQAMPKIIQRFPQVKVRIIGIGMAEDDLKKLVKDSGLNGHFIFHGFIKDKQKVADILSCCALGVAPWVSSQDDNALYADPGKPKFYAFCGLPVIITNGPAIADEIAERGAGIKINYNVDELLNALIKLLQNDEILQKYRKNAIKFAQSYVSEYILDGVFENTLSKICPVRRPLP